MQETASKRLFIAVALPAPQQDILFGLQTNFPGLKWTGRENLHLTVRFIGDVPLQDVPAVKTALMRVRVQRFVVRIQGLGIFDRHQRAVLWAGIEPCAQLKALKRRVNEALCRDAGIMPDSGCFSPHITLGRLKTSAAPALREFVKKQSPGVGSRFAADSFVLYSSILLPSGAVHTAEATYFMP